MADFVGKSDIDKVFDLAKLKKTQKRTCIKKIELNIENQVNLFKSVNQRKICPALLLLKKQKPT